MTVKHLHFAALSGPLHVLPLAVVTLEIDGQKLELEVAVTNNLRYDALLGRDVSFLWNLGSHLQVLDYVGMVPIQAQRKQTDAETVAAEEATKASHANVTSWEEVQEQPSEESSKRDKSVEQSETSVVEQQVDEPSEWLDEEVSDANVWYDRNTRQRTFEVGEQGTDVASCTEGQVVSRMERSIYHPQKNYGRNI